MRFFSLLKSLTIGLVAVAAPRAAADTRAFVVVYDGWGTPTSFVVTGRVLEDQHEKAAAAGTSEGENLIDNIKALESDEVRDAEVRVTIHGQTFTATSDEDGVFQVRVKNLPAAQALPVGAVPVSVTVTAGDMKTRAGHGTVFIADGAGVGLVSDIDDTVVKTYVTDKLKMAGEVLLKNARQLEPVAGAAANYTTAQSAGVSAFFYLSGSPQNFYPRLKSFLAGHAFPNGPLLLKNIGEDNLLKQGNYKAKRLEMLARDLPLMRFILVGDSGEHDPEIYKEFRRTHADRVVAVVIRKTPGSEATLSRFVDMIVVDDKYAADDVISRLLR